MSEAADELEAVVASVKASMARDFPEWPRITGAYAVGRNFYALTRIDGLYFSGKGPTTWAARGDLAGRVEAYRKRVADKS